jgi:hypothetical protein
LPSRLIRMISPCERESSWRGMAPRDAEVNTLSDGRTPRSFHHRSKQALGYETSPGGQDTSGSGWQFCDGQQDGLPASANEHDPNWARIARFEVMGCSPEYPLGRSTEILRRSGSRGTTVRQLVTGNT